MANQGAMHNHPAQHVGPVAVHLQGRRELLIEYARVLMLCGAVGAISIAGSPGGGNATQALICLLLWLLGVWLLALVPAAERLPQAAILIGVVVASAVLRHVFTPWNY